MHIAAELIDKVKESATLKEVVADFLPLSERGKTITTDCPNCGGKKKLNIVRKQGAEFWKCFVCDKGGKGSVSFLIDCQGMEYLEAIRYLADKYCIDLEPASEKNGKWLKPLKTSFRDQQLTASGISYASQKCRLKIGDGEWEEIDRYQVGTVDERFHPKAGDDMLLHYIGLDGDYMRFRATKTGKLQKVIRVRFQNPWLHKDKNGNPVKYKSPYGSGSHLWIPEKLRRTYENKGSIKTLVITEGEKKADKLCMHGIDAVAVMGIHNFTATGTMPGEFERIIKRCDVENILFLLDSDWQKISVKPGKPVDLRPRTFFKAVLKFQEYFAAYSQVGVHLNLYFGYVKTTKDESGSIIKGIDDLLVQKLKDQENKLVRDMQKAMIDRQGHGEWLNCHKITSESDYNLKKYWHLNSPADFARFHRAELEKLESFKIGRTEWRFGEDGELELAQQLQENERFWGEEQWEDRSGKQRSKLSFDYFKIRHFLRNRGYHRIRRIDGSYQFAACENKVLREVCHQEIRDYVIDFSEQIGKTDVTRMLLKGGRMYLGAEALSCMYLLEPMPPRNSKDCQYLFFRHVFWEITAETMTEKPITALTNHIWRNQQIDYAVKMNEKPLFSVDQTGEGFDFRVSPASANCHAFKFCQRTSWFSWQQDMELKSDKKGRKRYVFKEERLHQPSSAADEREMREHLLQKIIAIGYLVHGFRDKSELKAVVCMDGKESEVGKSEGGTGKSLFAKMISKVANSVIIDGKKPRLTEDPHLYEQVDERTNLVVFNDCRTNLDFEFFFGHITEGITVNPKGKKKFTLSEEHTPKFLFNTNHAVGGEGSSFRRRQYLVAFSDWYNEHRSPVDDFGCIFFDEWDDEQWNLFYNFIACCVQTYLRFRLDFVTDSVALEKRRLRQQMGEGFLDWAETFFSKENHRNTRVEKREAYQDFIELYPGEKRYCSIRRFKDKLKWFCKYSGLEFNPTASPPGSAIKSGGKEFVLIADEDCNPSSA